MRIFFTNLSKFNKIVFDTHVNFIQLSNISKIFLKVSTKSPQDFCKIYTNFIHNLLKFLKNSKIFKIPGKFSRIFLLLFFKISTNIPQNSNFRFIFYTYCLISIKISSDLKIFAINFIHVFKNFLKN